MIAKLKLKYDYITILAFCFFLVHINCVYAQKKRIPVMASHAIAADYNTLENYIILEEAGFTLAKQYYPSIDVAIAHLNTARKTRVKIIVECPELSKDWANNVIRLKGYKSFGGYDVFDEPGKDSFEKIASTISEIKQLDGKHHIWVNLFPILVSPDRLQMDSYEEYVKHYIETVRPQFVSFDCYGINKWGLHADYFKNLEIISEQCKKAGVPFWAYVLASQFDVYAEPTKGTISFQAYCNLAYGAQGIEYFSYRRIVQGALNITMSPIDTNYQIMPIYNDVKELNAELHFYSKYFYGNDVKEVTHLNKNIPVGTKPTKDLPYGIKVLRYSGKGFIVSYFTKGRHEYLLFVNRDYSEPQIIELETLNSLKRLSYYKRERYKGSGILQFETQPGSIVLLKLK